jgi:hypothetical protein
MRDGPEARHPNELWVQTGSIFGGFPGEDNAFVARELRERIRALRVTVAVEPELGRAGS